MEFKVGDQVKVFTSPGIWMDAEVYEVGPDWLEVGNGDPVYHGTEIRDSFRVHKSDARPQRPWETGDVVAVLAADGSVAYYGEIAKLPTDGQTKFGIFHPEIDETHYVAEAGGEGFREATEAETDDYIDRWGDPEVFNSDDALGSPE